MKRKNLISCTNALFFLAFTTLCMYQTALAADPQYTITPDESAYVTNGDVKVIVRDADKTYIGGLFDQVGPYTGRGVSVSADTGVATANFSKVDNTVDRVVSDGSGGWYIAGFFTNVGGLTRNHLARIRSDGTVDPDWNPNPNGYVRALTVNGDKLYVGGSFTNIGGQPRNNLASLDPSGAPTAWSPNANGCVNTIAIEGDTAYVGGSFYSPDGTPSIGGKARKYIAALKVSDGTAINWSPNVDDGTGAGVGSIAISTGTVYVLGGFRYLLINGVQYRALIAFDATTGALKPWYPKIGRSQVLAMAVSGNKVYLGGGNLTSTGNCVAAVDTTVGDIITSWNPDGDPSGRVSAIAVDGDRVYIGGGYNFMGGKMRHNLAAVDATTGAAIDWNPNANGPVYAVGISNGMVYVGGAFTGINGAERHYIAQLDSSGKVTSWDADISWYQMNFVNVIAVNNGTVYFSGQFFKSLVGGQYRPVAAAVDALGHVTPWDPYQSVAGGSMLSGTVVSMVVVGDRIYVGGNLTGSLIQKVTDQPLTFAHLVALDPVYGRIIPDWNPSADGYITSIAVSGDTMYAAGYFKNIGGQARNGLAALNLNTGQATSWNPNPDKVVHALEARGSYLYVGGDFTNISGNLRNRLAAFDMYSGSITAWDPNVANGTIWDPNDLNSSVTKISANAEAICVTGTFIKIGNQSRTQTAAIDTAGNVISWYPSFATAGGAGGVYVAKLTADYIHTGGVFTYVNGIPRDHFAQFKISSAPPVTYYSLSGRATISGAALSGVTMVLSGATTACATTDINGTYTFVNLANATYTVTPKKAGFSFTPVSRSVTIADANTSTQDFTAMPLPNTYSITGTVTSNQAGMPEVGIMLGNNNFYSVFTDGNGNYAIANLTNGTYMVNAVKPNSAYTFSPYCPNVTIAGANKTQNFTGTLVGTYSISGRVSGAGYIGVSGVTMALTGAANISVTTDSGGYYSIVNLNNGTYTVTPSKANYTFSPVSQSYTISGANKYDLNFSATLWLLGDVSGDGFITMYDASLAARYAAGLIKDGGDFTPEQKDKADVTGDSNVTAYDASFIARRAVGLITEFPRK